MGSSVTFEPIDLSLGSLTIPPSEFHRGPALNIRDRLLSANGGRIDRAEVRGRAGEAMLRNLPPHIRCPNHAKEWVIVGGGPSINDNVAQIRALKRRGANVVSVNKSHDWLLGHGITPWGHVLLDPMDWVAQYVQRPRHHVNYFIASQCHKDTFEALKGYPIFLWHAGQDFEEGAEPASYLKEYWPTQPWYVVPGPTTVGLRALFLGNRLGPVRPTKFHLFGFDSSRTNGKMHAYPKTEAPDARSGRLMVTRRGQRYVFDTNTHMARQWADFDKLVAEIPDHLAANRLPKGFTITMYGSGLLPFYAAGIRWHADPACNDDPSKVGGYVAQEPADFSLLVV